MGGGRGRRRLVRRSDSKGQFGERCWDPVVQVEVEGQFVVTAAHVLDKRMPCTDARTERSRVRPRIGLNRALG